MKKQLTASALVFAFLLTGCVDVNWGGNETVRGSGQIETENRSVSGFDRVSVAGSGHLEIVQGEEEALSIQADDNLLPYLESEVVGGHLKIRPRRGVNLRPSKTIQYRLSLRDLNELRVSGSLDAESASVETDDLELGISGSGRIEIGTLRTESLSMRISGSGSGEFAGKAPKLDVHISGSGDFKAGGLASETADVHISGSGGAELWVAESLEARISGSGNVRYFGRPLVNQHISGSGNLRSLGEK